MVPFGELSVFKIRENERSSSLKFRALFPTLVSATKSNPALPQNAWARYRRYSGLALFASGRLIIH
jgi:hypothetical protein